MLQKRRRREEKKRRKREETGRQLRPYPEGGGLPKGSYLSEREGVNIHDDDRLTVH